MTDIRSIIATSVARKMVCESNPLRYGRSILCEDVEGKNINRAEKYIKEKHPEVIGQKLEDGTTITPRIITQEIRNTFKNVRGPQVNGKDTCKFLLGVTRIYFEDLKNDQASFQRKVGQLDSYLGIINAAHADEYDQNLNGMSFEDMKTKFASAAKASVDADITSVSSRSYTKNNDYEIIPIDSFEEASKYGQYTSWCVTHHENMYDAYTHGGLGRFYFCLKHGFEQLTPAKFNVEAKDEYGLSMIAISVNEDGSLNTCTFRHNHSYGGNDNMMNTQQISDFFGVNFYKTFKPRNIDDIWAKLKENDLPDALSTARGWLLIDDDDESGRHQVYCERKDGRIVKYARVWGDRWQIRDDEHYCIAGDHFYWFDADGNAIEPPEDFGGQIQITNWPSLVSLKGLPTSIREGLIISECNNLMDVSGMANVESFGSFVDINRCKNVDSNTIEALVKANPNIAKAVISDPDAHIEDGKLKFTVELDDLEELWGGDVEFKTCKSILEGDYYWGDDRAPDVGQMDDGDFDKVMKENGLDLRWEDLGSLVTYDDDSDMVNKGVTEDQCEQIKDLAENDFDDESGNGIMAAYEDCARYGTEVEACNTIENAITDRVPPEFDPKTGKVSWLSNDKMIAAFPLDSVARAIATMWCDEDFFDFLEDTDNTIPNFLKAYNWDELNYDFDHIDVVEPRYGWDGFDGKLWKEMTAKFAKRVVKILTGHEAIEQEKQA